MTKKQPFQSKFAFHTVLVLQRKERARNYLGEHAAVVGKGAAVYLYLQHVLEIGAGSNHFGSDTVPLPFKSALAMIYVILVASAADRAGWSRRPILPICLGTPISLSYQSYVGVLPVVY